VIHYGESSGSSPAHLLVRHWRISSLTYWKINVRRVSNNSIIILTITPFFGWSEEMWSGNNYKNNKF